MRFKKYLPEFVSSIKEFQELDQTVSAEIDDLRNKIQQIELNQFIETADEDGLKKHEQLIGLSGQGDVDLRRFNILNKYNSTIPFTMVWLKNMLNTTIGKGNFLLDMNYGSYILTISIATSKEHLISSLYKDLRKKIPCNMVLNITTLAPVEADNYIGFYIRSADQIKI